MEAVISLRVPWAIPASSGPGPGAAEDQVQSPFQSLRSACGGKGDGGLQRERKAGDQGELQITSYGISGIPVFQVSRHIALALPKGERAELVVDLAPWMEEEEFCSFLKKRAEEEKPCQREIF